MRDKKNQTCCDGDAARGPHVEAILSIDERGQMVLPKDVRERAGIRPGDKLALISMERDDRVCCLTLVKSSALSGMLQEFLEPLWQGMQGVSK